MKRILLLFLTIVASLSLNAQTYSEAFDTGTNWACNGSCTSYSSHSYDDASQPVSFSSNLSVRETSGTQNGFPKTHSGTYSWRLRNNTGSFWQASIPTGGVVDFSVWVRRWDNSPEVNYTCEYSTDNGATWTQVATIDHTFLDNSSDWKKITGTVNSMNSNILIKISRNGGERLIIDDFTFTQQASSCPLDLTTTTFCNIDNDPVTWSAEFAYSGAGTSDYTVATSAGTLNGADGMDSNTSGYFYVNGIPVGQNVTVTVTDSGGNCNISEEVSAPDCSCNISDVSISFAGCTSSDEFQLTIDLQGGNYGNIEGSIDGGTTWMQIFDNELFIANPTNQQNVTLTVRSINDNSCQASTTFNMTTCPPPAAPNLYINEFHYDNNGTDYNEFIEIYSEVQLANPGDYTLIHYNGGGGSLLINKTLDNLTEYSDNNGYYYVWEQTMQNSNEGIALCGPSGLIEFISYEGVFTAQGGCAANMSSTDVNTSESSSTPVGGSIQKIDGSWIATAYNTKGYTNHTSGLFDETTESCLENTIGTIVAGSDYVNLAVQGGVIAAVNPNNQNLGKVTCSVYKTATPREDADGTNYLDRTMYITPETQPENPVFVKFYFTASEITSIKNASSGDSDAVSGASDLGVTKVSGSTCAATVPGGGIFIPSTDVTSGTDDIGSYLEFSVTSFSTFAPHGGNAPLPVNLIDFNAINKGSFIELTWTTASELNNDYFSIERSENGKAFSPIGKVLGNGDVSTTSSYSFMDESPNINNYYRLKQVDVDGSYEYSKIISANRELEEKVVLKSNNIGRHIMIENGYEVAVNYGVFNIHGKEVLNGQLKKGYSTIDASELNNGMYFIVFHEGGQVYTEKIYKL